MAKFIEHLLCCPKGCITENCPFSETRKLPFEEKVNWVMTRSNDEIREMLSFHQNCLDQTVLT